MPNDTIQCQTMRDDRDAMQHDTIRYDTIYAALSHSAQATTKAKRSEAQESEQEIRIKVASLCKA